MDQRKMQIDRQYEELIQRIDELDEDSFEKRELSSCFLDREDLEDRLDFEEGRKFFDDLKAKQEDAYLVRIKVKQIFIDFNVVSFKKLFSKEKIVWFGDLLLKLDEESRQMEEEFPLSFAGKRLHFVWGDEESGEVAYEIGVYLKPDLKELEKIFISRYRLQTYDEEEFNDVKNDDGILLSVENKKRILCEIDSFDDEAYIEPEDEGELYDYVMDEEKYITARVIEADPLKDRYIAEVSVYKKV